jgi:hypothetical protein
MDDFSEAGRKVVHKIYQNNRFRRGENTLLQRVEKMSILRGVWPWRRSTSDKHGNKENKPFVVLYIGRAILRCSVRSRCHESL